MIHVSSSKNDTGLIFEVHVDDTNIMVEIPKGS